MKKLVLFTAALFSSISLMFAQDNVVLYIADCPDNLGLCLGQNQTVYVYSVEGCTDFEWFLNGQSAGSVNPLIINPTNGGYAVSYHGYSCGFYHDFSVVWRDSPVPTAFVHDVWKRLDGSVEIEAVGADSTGWQYGYSYQWSTGATTRTIEVSQTGTYTCEISSVCGSTTRTFIVKDNVEIVSASVDPSTNKNLVTWDVTPEQATYISNVIVNRDGVDIATVPYTDGQFLDNIGSDLAARIYTIVGVCPDGTLCPIQSLSRGTIHMAFLPDINGNVEMTWNQPELGGADIHVGRFEICEYDPNSNEINVIDFVSSVTTSYSCNLSMFDYGYPLIRAVIQDGRGERDILSNRTNEIVGQPHEITINLKPGWTWISYPYAVVKSFASAWETSFPWRAISSSRSLVIHPTITDNGEETCSSSFQDLATCISRRAPHLPPWFLTCPLPVGEILKFWHAEFAELWETRSDAQYASGRVLRFLRILREIISLRDNDCRDTTALQKSSCRGKPDGRSFFCALIRDFQSDCSEYQHLHAKRQQ